MYPAKKYSLDSVPLFLRQSQNFDGRKFEPTALPLQSKKTLRIYYERIDEYVLDDRVLVADQYYNQLSFFTK